MHIRKASSFTPDEISFLAKFPLLTFEKMTGHKTEGSNEAGTIAAASAVKRINPKSKILFYLNVLIRYDQYEANETVDRIPDAFLQSIQGGDFLVRGKVRTFDLSNEAVREWWIGLGDKMAANSAIDGLFLDGVVKVIDKSYLRKAIGGAKAGEVRNGYELMLGGLREAIGSDKLLVGNIIRARLDESGLNQLGLFDGSYIEGIQESAERASREDYLAASIEAIQQAARSGKIIAFTSALVPTADPHRGDDEEMDEQFGVASSDEQARQALIFPLSVFLICAEKYSYFRAREGYSADKNNRWMRWFPEYDKPLGPPKGPARKVGYKYSREFENAVVNLDLAAGTGDIQWRDSPAKSGGF